MTTSRGGWIWIKKSIGSRAPRLANASAYLLASLKQWLILTKGIFLRPSLQSDTITFVLFDLPFSLHMRSITTFTPNSISIAGRFREMHSQILSLKTHNLAATLIVTSIAWAYPFTQPPTLSRIIPHPPTRSVLPNNEPLEFNLNQLRTFKIWN